MKRRLVTVLTAAVLATACVAGCMENVTNTTSNTTTLSSKTSIATTASKTTATLTPGPSSVPTRTSTPSLSMNTLRLAPGHPQNFEWGITNTGTADAWIAPYAILYKQTATAPGYARDGDAIARYARDETTGNWTTAYHSGEYDWFNARAGHTYRFYSGPVVPADVKWAVYNARLYYNEAFHGWLYSSWPYATLR